MSIRILFDDDFDHDIVRGLRRRCHDMDFVTVVEAGLRGAPDSAILDYAAQDNRIVFTHDISTMTAAGYSQIATAHSFPGMIVVIKNRPIAQVIDDLLLVVLTTTMDEWGNSVGFVPL